MATVEKSSLPGVCWNFRFYTSVQTMASSVDKHEKKLSSDKLIYLYILKVDVLWDITTKKRRFLCGGYLLMNMTDNDSKGSRLQGKQKLEK